MQLNRKLTTARALLSYEKKCAETRLLEAAEEQRQLRVKLLHLEPEYEAIQQDCNNHERYIGEIDKTLAVTNERLSWSESAVIRYKQRIKELEVKLQAQQIIEGSEKNLVEAELEALRIRYKTIEEKLKSSKNELEQERQNSERAIEPRELQNVQNEVATLLRENRELRQTVSSLEAERVSLRGEITTLQTRLQNQAQESVANHSRESTNSAEKRELERELSRLRAELASTQKESTQNQTLKASNTAEKKELEKELSRLRVELKLAQNEFSANKTLAASNAVEKKELEKQLSNLRAELKSALKESAENLTHDTSNSAEKKDLEKELSRLRTELKSAQKASTTQIASLENELSNSKKLLNSTQKTVAELRTTAPTSIVSNAEADLKADVAKEIAARKKLEKDFYNFVSDSDEKHALLKSKLDASRAKLAALRAATNTVVAPVAPMVPLMTMDDLSHSVKRPRKEGPKTSDFSLTPFFKKHAVVTTGSPLSPSAVVVGDDATLGGDDTTIVDRSMRAERSILIPSAIESTEPTRLLLAGATRKRKLPSKPAPAPAPAPIPEEESEEEAPHKPQPKKKRAKKVPGKAVPEPVHIFDTPAKDEPKAKGKKNMPPTSIFDDDPPVAKAVPKKRRRPVGLTQAFREDDGTGRLVLAGDSADAPGGAGLTTLRPPVSGVFTKEISPPKKRPEVLRQFFAGKKKIQGR